MQPIRVTSGPPTENKGVESVPSFQMNIYQNNNCPKDLGWFYFGVEPRAKEKLDYTPIYLFL